MLRPDVQEQIKQYLWEVAAHLGDRRPEERADILYSLETHITDTLAARAPDAPTSDDLANILADLPTPAAYGPSNGDALPGDEGVFSRPALPLSASPLDVDNDLATRGVDSGACWESLVGLGLALLALATLVCGIALISLGDFFADAFGHVNSRPLTRDAQVSALIGCILLLVSLVCLITSSYLGGAAIMRIRLSGWCMKNLWAALIARLSFVLVLFDAVIYLIVYGLFYFIGVTGLVGLIAKHGIAIAFILGLDYLILRIERKNVMQPSTSPDLPTPVE